MTWKRVVAPAAVIAALGGTVALNGVVWWAASGPGAAVVEPDYYRKGLAWDSTLAARSRSDALGWRLEATLSGAGGGADLAVRLTDRDGHPVRGAVAHVTAIHNVEAVHPVTAQFVCDGDGRGRTRLPLAHRGLWELRFDVRAADARFVTELRRDLPAGDEHSAVPAAEGHDR